MGNPDSRIEFIDAVRGIAALLVLVMHLTDFNLPQHHALTHDYLRLGTIGVAAFFLVSGFVIPMTLERSGQRRFWISRIFRLYPLYLVVLLISVISGCFGLWPWSLATEGNLVTTLLLHLPIAQSIAGAPNFVGGSWTLFIELVFYTLFSLAAVIGLGKRHLLLAILANLAVLALVAFGLVLDRRIPLGYPCLLLCSFTGVVFYRHFRGEANHRVLLGTIAAAIATTTVAFWYNYSRYPATEFSFLCAWTSWMAAFALFGGAYLLRGHVMPRILVWLGAISYSVYLAHDLILFNAITILGVGWWNLILVPVLVVPLAWVAHLWVERPGIRLGKWLAQSPQDRDGAVAPQASQR